MSSRKNKAESSLHKKSLVCFWLHSYVATRFGASFSACQRALMCIFLHACHAAEQGVRVGWGVGGGPKTFFAFVSWPWFVYFASFNALLMLRCGEVLL